MTDKRFELEWSDTGEYLVDNETGLKHHIYSPDYRFHVRDMMNELADENEQLKSDCDYRWKKYCNTRKEMLHENEQLKRENEQLKSFKEQQIEEYTKLKKVCTECKKENEQLKQALKNSYINEICENCKHGNYFLSDNFDGGFEGDFECMKKHFGNDDWKCDGLTECDDFELKIER